MGSGGRFFRVNHKVSLLRNRIDLSQYSRRQVNSKKPAITYRNTFQDKRNFAGKGEFSFALGTEELYSACISLLLAVTDLDPAEPQATPLCDESQSLSSLYSYLW